MALAASTATLLAVVLFAFVAAALGHRLFRLCSLEIPDSAEHLLCCEAAGVICIEIFLFLSQLSGHIRAGVFVVLAGAVLFASNQFAAVSRRFFQVLSAILNGSKSDKALASLAGLFLLI
jgi:hypothetical protein